MVSVGNTLWSANQGHVVPTALAHHGVFYVGSLGEFDPQGFGFPAGQGQVLRITAG